jgi:hypothetical protein
MQGVAPAKAAELIAALRRQGARGGTDHPDDIIATTKRLLDDGGLQESHSRLQTIGVTPFWQ